MAAATSDGRRPSSAFVSAAAALIRPRIRMIRLGIRCPEMGKLRTARWVEAPHRASAGTSISPMESRSIRVGEGVGLVMTRVYARDRGARAPCSGPGR